MSSLDSYIKERNERIEKGTLAYGGSTNSYAFSPLKNDFSYKNRETFKTNNGMYPSHTRY